MMGRYIGIASHLAASTLLYDVFYGFLVMQQQQ